MVFPFLGSGEGEKDAAFIRRALLLSFSTTFGVLCLALFLAFGPDGFGRALFYSLASFFVGMLPGFLFGIPKLRSVSPSAPVPQPGVADQAAPGPAAQGGSRYNTNLEELSDWLTKIIVGLGLASLSAIPKSLESLGRAAAATFPKSPSQLQPVIIATLVAFVIFGFISTYLTMQIFLAHLLTQSADALAKTEGKVADDAIRQTQAQLKEAPPPAQATIEDPKAAMESLVQKAEDYLRISGIDHSSHVAEENAAAAEMGQLVNAASIDRDKLSDTTNEGIMVALANAIIANPTPRDSRRLLTFGPRSSRPHVQYAIVLAYLTLLNRSFVSATDKPQFLAMFDHYYSRADPSLRTVIDVARRRTNV